MKMKKKHFWKNPSQSCLSIFLQNARLNKQTTNEEAGFDVERDKIQILDTNIVNMMAESLNFWLTKFVEEVCKEDGERYPHWNAEFTVCGSVLYICDFL